MNSDYGASTRMGDVMAQPGLHPKLNKASWQQLGPHLVSQHQSTQVLLVAALASDLWMDIFGASCTTRVARPLAGQVCE